jgi:hypothetical protein
VGSLDTRERDRTGPEFGGQLPLDLAGAVPETGGQLCDRFPVDDAVPIRRTARPTTSARAFQAEEPGTASARHRRHARKPEPWAAAAVGKEHTFCRFGVVAGQLGWQ